MNAIAELERLLAGRASLVERAEGDGASCTPDDVARAAARLRTFGLVPGDPIALVAERRTRSVTALLGALAAELAVLPIAPHHPQSRARELINRADARLVIGDATSGPPGAPTCGFDALLDDLAAPVPRARRHGVALPQAGTIVETSGSSGRPKLCVHALDAHLSSARAAAKELDLDVDDRWLLSLPLHHVGGLAILFRSIVSGATVVMPAPDERTGDAVARTSPTRVSMVATQLADALEDRSATHALRAARTVLAGGGPIPLALRQRAVALSIPLVVSYGSTEAASMIAASPALLSAPSRVVPLAVITSFPI